MKYLSIKEAGIFILGQTSLAAVFGLGVLLAIEWALPGSVLPLFNLMELLLPAAVIALGVGVFYESKAKFTKIISIILGICVLTGLTLALWSHLDSGGIRMMLLMGAASTVVASWIFLSSKKEI